MTPKGRRKLLSLAYYLRQRLPAKKPIEVRLIHLPPRLGVAGYSTDNGKRYRITIERHCSLNEAASTLCHEWAHCLAGVWTGEDDRDHGRDWGIAVAKVERAFIAWLEWRQKKEKRRGRQ
jgi:hypothetical protein